MAPEVEGLSEDTKDAHHGARENKPRPAGRRRPALQHHVRRELLRSEVKERPLQEPESEVDGEESGQRQ